MTDTSPVYTQIYPPAGPPGRLAGHPHRYTRQLDLQVAWRATHPDIPASWIKEKCAFCKGTIVLSEKSDCPLQKENKCAFWKHICIF